MPFFHLKTTTNEIAVRLLCILVAMRATTATLTTTTTAATTTTTMNSIKNATYQEGSPKNEKIKDIQVNITLYDKRIPQLQVSWHDNLPPNTSYNVLVSALNPSLCHELPCSVYGKKKPETFLLIPENPMSYIDVLECSYMFGCSYKLTVETSSAMLQASKPIDIPNCIMDVCSCRHASEWPKVKIVAHIPNNVTINLNWLIELKNETKLQALFPTTTTTTTESPVSTTLEIGMKTKVNSSDYNLHNETRGGATKELLDMLKAGKLYVKVSEQTNPSLSWGGKLRPIAEQVYVIGNLSLVQSNGATLQGRIQIKVQQAMYPRTVINLHAFVEDKFRCAGPPSLVKIIVPASKEALSASNGEAVNNGRTIITGVLVVFGASLAMIVAACFLCRRKRRRLEAERKKNEPFMTPFAPMIEMEDNLNYVDKDVEEAQAKGLADIFEVPHHAVQLQCEIGEGAFGRVYKGIALNLRRMRGATVVAVKQLKKNPSADEISEFLSEIEMLKGVGTHNNIVCFLGCCTIRPPYLMIMEYVGRGDLLSYLRTVRQYTSRIKPGNANNTNSTKVAITPVNYAELKISTQSVQSVDSDVTTAERQPKPSCAETTYTIINDYDEYHEPFEYKLDHKELHNFALQIANGMRFLEEQEITHRDLAARNVLIDERKTLKISDFGLSRHGIYTNTKTRKLPLRWLSIEAIRDNIYSNKSDVWAFGVVLWEIGSLGASPYSTISNSELIPFLMSGQRLDKPEICTQQVYMIMLQCWNEDPVERPTFEDLYMALSQKPTYVDLNSLDDYVFPPIKDKEDVNSL